MYTRSILLRYLHDHSMIMRTTLI